MGIYERRRAEADASVLDRRSRLPQLAHCLRDFGAQRVWCVGSTARGMGNAWSDIDLLEEGIPLRDLLRARAACERFSGPFAVDVIALETLTPRQRELFLEEATSIREP